MSSMRLGLSVIRASRAITRAYRGIGLPRSAGIVTPIRGIGLPRSASIAFALRALSPMALVNTDKANRMTASHLFIDSPWGFYPRGVY